MGHRTQLLLDQVAALQQTGQWHAALDLCRKIFHQSWLHRRPDDLLEVVLRTGFAHSGSGNREVAVEHFELAQTLADLQDDNARSARALNGLGVLYQGMGEIGVAEAHYLKAKEKARYANDRVTSGDIEQNIGTLANIRGDLHSALQHYELAYSEYDASGNRHRVARLLNNLGMLYIDLGRNEDAGESLERALNISRSLADLATEGIVHTNRAELFLATGDLGAARTSCDNAFEIASKTRDDAIKADVLKWYGVLYRETDKPHLAESHLRQAIVIASKVGNRLTEAETFRELSLVLRRQERNREALEALNQSHALFSAVQAAHDQADINARFEQLENDFLSLVEKWGESIEAKDLYTRGHCQRVADYACIIASQVGLADKDLTWFRMGAFLHDVGKTEVPEEILNKPGKLTDEERRIIEQHTIAGDRILSEIEFPWDIRPMVRWHHERWDGGGYPDGLKGEEIPLTARIMKVADVFDALTTTRSYREPLTPDQAFEIMVQDGDSFDPELFELFRTLYPTLITEGQFNSQVPGVNSDETG